MKIVNTVFKINTKEKGYSFFWTILDALTIEEIDELENLFPKKRISSLSGFSLGISCCRRDKNSIFIAIKSDWNISDSFGRKGLSLCQGSILHFNPHESTSISEILEYILGCLRVYDRGYERLENLLSQIALDESKKHREEFFLYLDQETRKSTSSFNEKDLLLTVISSLDLSEGKKFRIYSEYPLHEYVGLCCLIWLQIENSEIKFIGAGDLQEYDRYDHISTSRKIEGFEDRNINQFFYKVSISYKSKTYFNKFIHKVSILYKDQAFLIRNKVKFLYISFLNNKNLVYCNFKQLIDPIKSYFRQNIIEFFKRRKGK
jgi:hypothetical protein